MTDPLDLGAMAKEIKKIKIKSAGKR